MRKVCSTLHGGVLAGLALLVGSGSFGDEVLRDNVHRQYRHQSYMLIEDSEGARLYLFDNDGATVRQPLQPNIAKQTIDEALSKLHSSDARTRVRGLTELAGMAHPQALDAALTLLTDPSPAVRDEAAQMVLDHPDGAVLVSALGLVEDEHEDKDEDEDAEGY